MATLEERIGIIDGLADVTRAQYHSSKEVTTCTQDNIQELLHAVAELTKGLFTPGRLSRLSEVSRFSEICLFLMIRYKFPYVFT